MASEALRCKWRRRSFCEAIGEWRRLAEAPFATQQQQQQQQQRGLDSRTRSADVNTAAMHVLALLCMLPCFLKLGDFISYYVLSCTSFTVTLIVICCRERKCAENYNKWHNKYFKNAMSISNHNSFRVLFDKIDSVYFISKIYLYFNVGKGQPSEPALCQLYRHMFVSYAWCVIIKRVVSHGKYSLSSWSSL